MSTTTTSPVLPRRATATSPTFRALAWAEARRFARHPLFLLGAVATFGITVATEISTGRTDPDVLALTITPAFFIGVFGFVVAHRLTTSLLRSREIADCAPVGGQLRTLALCTSCLVPALTGLAWMIMLVTIRWVWPPLGIPASAHVAWFRDEANLDVWGVLIAGGVLASLGGPLAGVAMARWAPFRGSALLGVVGLIAWVAVGQASTTASALAPYVVFTDETVKNGTILSSRIGAGVAPAWYVVYVACLCGLAVVAALLRGAQAGAERRLLGAGAALAVVAIAAFAMSVR